MDYRERLVEFYKQHNPEKLPSIDAILQSYAGREEQLLLDLHVKYGVRHDNDSQSEEGLAKYTKNFSRITDSVSDMSTNISEFLSSKDLAKDSKKGVTIVLPTPEANEVLQRLETENEKLRQDIKKLLHDKTSQQNNLDTASSTRKKLEQQINSLTHELNEKNAALNRVQEERGVLVCKCDNMASELADLVAANHRLGAQVTRLAAHLIIHPADKTTLSSTITDQDNSSPPASDDTLNTSIPPEGAISSSSCTLSQISALQAIIKASNTEMSVLNRQLLNTEKQLAASHKHATLLEARLQSATEEISQLTEKYESLSRYHTNDKMELDDIMKRLQERSVAAAEAEDEVKRLLRRIEQLEATKDEAIHACNDTIRSIELSHEEKMKSFVENVMMQHEEAFSYVSEVAQHERELQTELLDAAQGRIDQLQVELFRVRRLVSQKEHDILDLRDRVELLEKSTSNNDKL